MQGHREAEQRPSAGHVHVQPTEASQSHQGLLAEWAVNLQRALQMKITTSSSGRSLSLHRASTVPFLIMCVPRLKTEELSTAQLILRALPGLIFLSLMLFLSVFLMQR